MKWKIALALSLTTIISTSSMAMEITKGKFLSHKEWSNGKIQASFKESTTSPMVRQLIEKALKHRNQDNPPLPLADFIFSMANIHSIEVDNADNATINAFTDTYITNTTNSTHIYTIKTEVCLNTMFPNDDCATTTDLVATDPGGNVSVSRQPNITFHNTREFFIAFVQTSIYRDGSDSVFATMGYSIWGDVDQRNRKK